MASAAIAVRRRRLLIEFVALYFGAPLLIALFMPGHRLFEALAVLSLVGLVLLWRTGGFNFVTLVRGWSRLPWREIGGIAVITLLIGLLVLGSTNPNALFHTLRTRPGFLPVIWVFYPFLSALPQELIFRPLFFHRYASLLPIGRSAITLNAVVFSFAHLMYWSWIVAILTFVGGWFFARAYLRHGFPAAWVLHAVAGNVLFAVGMGAYFYSGNVVRPF
ncbi:CPBP family intramembrane glutamate endopeptidase [Paracoccus sp. MBLB3053]|uniref:CPBP family intramembrane glutamate endopeptidase n=1 Tax=Paracoccus aurantius TaxID=3073814 RepID=A0ABU2HM91_9RHOB|nr:CPBP family glutamic-type intramembrane protease [Paracoccus sp. MBLB3053]MDS9466152.1 CPBP family intramembrane glutamate endopeptidase [Paracoccus sp. MBLB3053]